MIRSLTDREADILMAQLRGQLTDSELRWLLRLTLLEQGSIPRGLAIALMPR